MGPGPHPGPRWCGDPIVRKDPAGHHGPMDATLICVLDDGPPAAAITAFGVWLGESIGARPRVCSAHSPEQILAVAAEHDARAIILARPARRGPAQARLRRLEDEFDGIVLALPSATIAAWLDPAVARVRAHNAGLGERLLSPAASA
jgi:hypothetical protein